MKWFVDPASYPTRYDLLLTPPVLVALAIAAAAVLVAAAFQFRFPEPLRVRRVERFAGLAPAALGVHLGVALIVATIVGILFVPSLIVRTDTPVGVAILAIQAACGLLIVLGLATRVAAGALALLGLVAMSMVGFTFESILEQVHILGIALFLVLIGRGPASLDRLRHAGRPLLLRAPVVPWAALTLARVSLGFAIFYGALTEKLLNPALSQALLAERPWLNAGRLVGLPDGQFVYLAGLIELVIGAVVISPFITRPMATIGAAIFTSTLPLFGWSELLGHLPYYGIFLLLVIAPRTDSPQVRRALERTA